MTNVEKREQIISEIIEHNKNCTIRSPKEDIEKLIKLVIKLETFDKFNY
jgi:uncharacterized membrane protein